MSRVTGTSTSHRVRPSEPTETAPASARDARRPDDTFQAQRARPVSLTAGTPANPERELAAMRAARKESTAASAVSGSPAPALPPSAEPPSTPPGAGTQAHHPAAGAEAARKKDAGRTASELLALGNRQNLSPAEYFDAVSAALRDLSPEERTQLLTKLSGQIGRFATLAARDAAATPPDARGLDALDRLVAQAPADAHPRLAAALSTAVSKFPSTAVCDGIDARQNLAGLARQDSRLKANIDHVRANAARKAQLAAEQAEAAAAKAAAEAQKPDYQKSREAGDTDAYLEQLAAHLRDLPPEEQARVLKAEKAHLTKAARHAAAQQQKNPQEPSPLLMRLGELASAVSSVEGLTLLNNALGPGFVALASPEAQQTAATLFANVPGFKRLLEVDGAFTDAVARSIGPRGVEQARRDLISAETQYTEADRVVKEKERELATAIATIPPNTPQAEREALIARYKEQLGYQEALDARSAAAKTYSAAVETALSLLATYEGVKDPSFSRDMHGLDGLRRALHAQTDSIGKVLGSRDGAPLLNMLAARPELMAALETAGVTRQALSKAVAVGVTTEAMGQVARGERVDAARVAKVVATVLGDEAAAQTLSEIAANPGDPANAERIRSLPPELRPAAALIDADGSESLRQPPVDGLERAEKVLDRVSNLLELFENAPESFAVLGAAIGNAAQKATAFLGPLSAFASAAINLYQGDVLGLGLDAAEAFGGLLMLHPASAPLGLAIVLGVKAYELYEVGSDLLEAIAQRNRLEAFLLAQGYDPATVEGLMAMTRHMSPEETAEFFRLVFREAQARGEDPREYMKAFIAEAWRGAWAGAPAIPPVVGDQIAGQRALEGLRKRAPFFDAVIGALEAVKEASRRAANP